MSTKSYLIYVKKKTIAFKFYNNFFHYSTTLYTIYIIVYYIFFI